MTCSWQVSLPRALSWPSYWFAASAAVPLRSQSRTDRERGPRGGAAARERTAPATAEERGFLPAGSAGAVARAGVDPTLPPRALQDALRGAIADRRGYVAWDVDAAGWVVALLRPEREDFRAPTLEAALAWCLVWLMVEDFAGGALA